MRIFRSKRKNLSDGKSGDFSVKIENFQECVVSHTFAYHKCVREASRRKKKRIFKLNIVYECPPPPTPSVWTVFEFKLFSSSFLLKAFQIHIYLYIQGESSFLPPPNFPMCKNPRKKNRVLNWPPPNLLSARVHEEEEKNRVLNWPPPNFSKCQIWGWPVQDSIFFFFMDTGT